MPTAITLASAGGAPVAAISCRMVTPWVGNWIADLELDPELPAVPAGPAVLSIAPSIACKCFVDPRAAGKFGSKAAVRVVGGMLGGWDRDVLAQDFDNPAGALTDAVVVAATAAEVGEVATVAPPRVLGKKFVRSAGPASRVLAGHDWHVDKVSGTTIVAPRVPAPADPTAFQVLDFDTVAQRAEVACDGVLEPGMLLVDPRFGTATVREVEQVWDEGGSRAVAWFGDAVKASRLAGALARLAFEACGVTFLRSYVCRVVLQNADGTLALQPIKFGELNPAALLTNVPVRVGVPGLSVKVVPGTECVLEFEGGDPSKPYVRTFSADAAIEVDIQGTIVAVTAGPSSGAEPVAKMTALGVWAGVIEGLISGLGATVPPDSKFAAVAASIASKALKAD